MKRLWDLNICICIVVTFLFELLDGSNMIPSQYRLAIAAIILIFDAIFAIYAIIERKIIQLIGLVYNFVKDWKSMKSVSKNR